MGHLGEEKKIEISNFKEYFDQRKSGYTSSNTKLRTNDGGDTTDGYANSGVNESSSDYLTDNTNKNNQTPMR